MSEYEFLEGYGTLLASEPTTLCDIANTLSYVKKITPAVEKVQRLLEDYESYTGTYDEEGRFRAGCVRNKYSYTTVYMENPPVQEYPVFGEKRPVEGTGKSTEQIARSCLGFQLWDAHVEYSRVAPELSEKLKSLREEFDRETEEMMEKGEL
jgi:hypothetical protein